MGFPARVVCFVGEHSHWSVTNNWGAVTRGLSEDRINHHRDEKQASVILLADRSGLSSLFSLLFFFSSVPVHKLLLARACCIFIDYSPLATDIEVNSNRKGYSKFH